MRPGIPGHVARAWHAEVLGARLLNEGTLDCEAASLTLKARTQAMES